MRKDETRGHDMAEEDKKKQSDLAKMGDLNKAVGESSSEPLSADENKKQEPAPADNDLKNELEREREKNKNLASIIEKVSSLIIEFDKLIKAFFKVEISKFEKLFSNNSSSSFSKLNLSQV